MYHLISENLLGTRSQLPFRAKSDRFGLPDYIPAWVSIQGKRILISFVASHSCSSLPSDLQTAGRF
jgi:hypothetical protein